MFVLASDAGGFLNCGPRFNSPSTVPLHMKSLIILGAGGAGLEALLVARRMGTTEFQVMGFADDNPALSGQTIEGVPVIGGVDAVLAEWAGKGIHFHCGIGRNVVRKKLTTDFVARGFLAATLIDPSAVIAGSAHIGDGTYIGAHVFVGPQARVGRGALINAGASIGHHCVLSDFSQVCPGGRLSGHSSLDEGAFVGSNGVTVSGITLGKWTILGANSLALKSVPSGSTAVGVPARVIARSESS